MAYDAKPLFGKAFRFGHSLAKTADPDQFWNATFVAGEVQVNKYVAGTWSGWTNIGTLPTTGSADAWDVVLSATEMTAEIVQVRFKWVSSGTEFVGDIVEIVPSLGESGYLLLTQVATTPTTTTFTTDDGFTAAVNDGYNGCEVVLVDASTGDFSIRQITDYSQSTNLFTINAAPEFTLAVDDIVVVRASRALQATTQGRTLTVSAAGAADADMVRVSTSADAADALELFGTGLSAGKLQASSYATSALYPADLSRVVGLPDGFDNWSFPEATIVKTGVRRYEAFVDVDALIPTTTQTIYVDSVSGSNSNDGLTAATAKLDFDGASGALAIANASNVEFRLLAGTYTIDGTLPSDFIIRREGWGTVTLQATGLVIAPPNGSDFLIEDVSFNARLNTFSSGSGGRVIRNCSAAPGGSRDVLHIHGTGKAAIIGFRCSDTDADDVIDYDDSVQAIEIGTKVTAHDSTDNANNASTAHGSARVVRVNCEYSNSPRAIHDVDTSKSVNLGCRLADSTGAPGETTSFLIGAGFSTISSEDVYVWVYGCECSGTRTVDFHTDSAEGFIFVDEETQYDNGISTGANVLSIPGPILTTPRPLEPTTAGRSLDVTATGAAGIDWGNVENQGATVGLSATTVDTVTNNTDMRGTDGANTTVPLAAAADQAEHDATQTTLAAIAGYIDTEIAAIKAVTDALPDNGALTTLLANVSDILTDTGTTLPATLSTIEGKVDANQLDLNTIITAVGALNTILTSTGVPLTADERTALAVVVKTIGMATVKAAATPEALSEYELIMAAFNGDADTVSSTLTVRNPDDTTFSTHALTRAAVNPVTKVDN